MPISLLFLILALVVVSKLTLSVAILLTIRCYQGRLAKRVGSEGSPALDWHLATYREELKEAGYGLVCELKLEGYLPDIEPLFLDLYRAPDDTHVAYIQNSADAKSLLGVLYYEENTENMRHIGVHKEWMGASISTTTSITSNSFEPRLSLLPDKLRNIPLTNEELTTLIINESNNSLASQAEQGWVRAHGPFYHLTLKAVLNTIWTQNHPKRLYEVLFKKNTRVTPSPEIPTMVRVHLRRQRERLTKVITSSLAEHARCLLLFSSLLFLVTGSVLWGAKESFLLLFVIVLHEAGHIFAMKIAGRTETSMIVIPFVGGVAISEERAVPASLHAFIFLMGPIPGLLLALGLRFVFPEETRYGGPLAELVWMLLSINMFNLLPIPPLDGGRIVKDLFFHLKPSLRPGIVLLSLAFVPLSLLSIATPIPGVAPFLFSFVMSVGVPTIIWLSRHDKVSAALDELGEAKESPSDEMIAEAAGRIDSSLYGADKIITELKRLQVIGHASFGSVLLMYALYCGSITLPMLGIWHGPPEQGGRHPQSTTITILERGEAEWTKR